MSHPILAVRFLLTAAAVLGAPATALAAHPADASGKHDDRPLSAPDPLLSQRDWTNPATNATFQGTYLAARGDQVKIQTDGGAVVTLTISELCQADQAEVQRHLDLAKRLGERTVALAFASLRPGDLAKPPGDHSVSIPPPVANTKSTPDSKASADATAGTKLNAPPQASVFELFAPSVKTRFDDRWLYVESDGLPPASLSAAAHQLMVGIKSWQRQVPLPQPYVGSNAWQIPLHPELADKPTSAKSQLYRGAIALAANGVPIFNALNNRGEDAFKVGELDEFGGHCGRADDYHYHTAPLILQKVVGNDKPIGYALDGFALYGLFDPAATKGQPKCCPLGGTDKLDEFNGHFGAPPGDAPPGTKGLYHYHASTSYPYINGGMRGKVTVVGDQVDPQPRALGARPALSPLRGATITGFQTEAPQSWKLQYTLAGKTHTVSYRLEPSGKVTFDFIEPDGTKTTETYTRREGGGGGGGGGAGDRRGNQGKGGGRGGRDGVHEDANDDGSGERRSKFRDQPGPPPRPPVDAPPGSKTVTPEPTFKRIDGFILTSPAVGTDGKLPAEFTCDGASHSPPLQWTKPPEGTKSLAVVMHHTPGPGDTHVYMVLLNVPAEITSLANNAKAVGKWGVNTVNQRKEYAPPCSKGPGDKTYTLTLYALSEAPKLDAGNSKITRELLLEAIKDTTLAAASLDVTYARPGAGSDKKQDNKPGDERDKQPENGPAPNPAPNK